MGWFDWIEDWSESLSNLLRERESRFSGELNAVAQTRFVSNADGKGWLMVRWDNTGRTFPPLPQFLKVRLDRVQGGRDHFTVLEGRNNGKTASVTHRPGGGSYLAAGSAPYTAEAKIKFDLSKEQLWYGEHGPISTITDSTNPVPIGTHVLQIPYESHSALSAGYESDSTYASTWFRIGSSGDRFLHAGRVSAGCATVTATTEWTNIYNYLITARRDTQNVGTIEVLAS